MEFITWKPWAVAIKQSEGTTWGPRVIHVAVPCVLKSNLFRPSVGFNRHTDTNLSGVTSALATITSELCKLFSVTQ